ncbi:hypothetical protein NLX83_13165 [Allokutzneria sp. A3M-2-11 16]|uniref:hypothetical protein n=1 Tax=Allokutzneria sp. A3M-2-11 16 TaxID=2962043 RepID=UPI0020B6CBE6|nr:hypothetical protein [Allokutzneria sp. A3M-2-11 16]MCP3800209.1 hypothetical protein [Allokutzneria sp. A3M-2-11 16]
MSLDELGLTGQQRSRADELLKAAKKVRRDPTTAANKQYAERAIDLRELFEFDGRTDYTGRSHLYKKTVGAINDLAWGTEDRAALLRALGYHTQKEVRRRLLDSVDGDLGAYKNLCITYGIKQGSQDDRRKEQRTGEREALRSVAEFGRQFSSPVVDDAHALRAKIAHFRSWVELHRRVEDVIAYRDLTPEVAGEIRADLNATVDFIGIMSDSLYLIECKVYGPDGETTAGEQKTPAVSKRKARKRS